MADEEKKQESITFDLKALEILEPKDKKSINFKAFIKSLGVIELDQEVPTVSTLLPKGFSSKKLTTALNLYADGYSSNDLEAIINNYVDKNPQLKEDAKSSLYAEPYLVRVFEDANLKNDRSLQKEINNLLTKEQIAEYSQFPTQPSLDFQLKDNVFQPVMRRVFEFAKVVGKEGLEEFKGFLGGVAKNKAKKVLGNVVKKSLKSAGKKLAKKGVSTLLSLAMKAGVQAAAAAATGFTSVIASIVIKVGGIIIRTIKSFGRNIINWIRRNKEKVAAAAVAMLTVGALLGSPFLIFGGLAVGALAWTVGGIHAFIFGVWGAFILPIVTMAVGSFAAFLLMVILITAFAYLIITSGAYIVPPGGFTGGPPIAIESQYVSVTKTVSSTSSSKCQQDPNNPYSLKCNNNELPVTVEYTVTVTALRGTLTEISFKNICRVSKEGSVPFCDHPTPDPPPQISPVEPYVFSYTITYDSRFSDSLISDTFTVNATAEGVSTSASGVASVTIGTPPTACFEISNNAFPWPGNYYNNINQAVSNIVGQYPAYAAKVCSGGPVRLCYDPPSVSLWGWHVHRSDCDILFDSRPMENSTDATYILAHEAGHHLARIMPSLYLIYTVYPGVSSERPLCTYSSSSQSGEAFAEAIALYITSPTFSSCAEPFQSKYPAHYNFVNQNVF